LKAKIDRSVEDLLNLDFLQTFNGKIPVCIALKIKKWEPNRAQ
jgi:hypothetical protein